MLPFLPGISFALQLAAQVQAPPPVAAAPPPTAQRALPGDGDGDVVVIAPTPIGRRAAKRYVIDISVTEADQLARYNTPVCPMAWGFPPGLRDLIVARLREDAVAVHASVAPPSCKGNMLVVAARDGAELVSTARRLHSPILGGVFPKEQVALSRQVAPVRAWTVIDPQDERGASVYHEPADGGVVIETHDASRLRVNVRQSIVSAVVVLEWSAIAGKTPTQIADYVAMRTLAKTRAGAADQASILALFAPAADPPREWTVPDRLYLRSLYDMTDYTAWRRQYDTLASDIARGTRGAAAR